MLKLKIKIIIVNITKDSSFISGDVAQTHVEKKKSGRGIRGNWKVHAPKNRTAEQVCL